MLLSFCMIRIGNAHILIAGIRAVSNEVAKNIVLAGIGSLTLLDHALVDKTDVDSHFFFGEHDVGKTVSKNSEKKLYQDAYFTFRTLGYNVESRGIAGWSTNVESSGQPNSGCRQYCGKTGLILRIL